MKLFIILVGCKPAGRNTEQHDVFFGIGNSPGDLTQTIKAWWPEANGEVHIDAWREVTVVNNYRIIVSEKHAETSEADEARLFFINLGGYKPYEFEEYHYKMVIAARNKGDAIAAARASAFYKHTGFEGAVSHIDDKYGIDVDDIYEINDILSDDVKMKYSISLIPLIADVDEDILHIGYLKISKF